MIISLFIDKVILNNQVADYNFIFAISPTRETKLRIIIAHGSEQLYQCTLVTRVTTECFVCSPPGLTSIRGDL